MAMKNTKRCKMINHRLKGKSEILNPKLETSTKLQIRMFKTRCLTARTNLATKDTKFTEKKHEKILLAFLPVFCYYRIEIVLFGFLKIRRR